MQLLIYTQGIWIMEGRKHHSGGRQTEEIMIVISEPFGDMISSQQQLNKVGEHMSTVWCHIN